MVSTAIDQSGHPADLSELQARALISRIATSLVTVWEDVKLAYLGRAWLALGYASWDELCAAEFGTMQIRLPREERREVVASLSEVGMSTRAIAAATGVHHSTVASDLPGVGNQTGASANVIGLDGKEYRRQSEPDPIVDAEIVKDERVLPPITAGQIAELREAEVRPIPPQQERRRRPITDAADDAGWEIRKAAERVVRLLDDDRFRKNEEQVALSLRAHLLFVAESVAAALEKLGTSIQPEG